MAKSRALLKEAFVPVAAVIAILMLVIPIPPWALDFFLIINIALSIAVLVSTMFINEVLDLSVFPSLLLLTTLFRLALEVTATRLILLSGDPGSVIQTFGRLVVGNNVVVGIIIFIILIVIQFMVITRGAERVSEVAARFTLDAMPGKQMAVDAELNAGLIREQEAKKRRQDIEREADFYGAMDGASKFVRGDAIAGIIIVFINIIGGLIIGLSERHLAITTALNTYTILTIGEGITTQIPALLLSTATGILVTRSGSQGTLNKDVLNQLTQLPRVLYIVAIVLFLMAALGLPPFVPLSLGAIAFYGGWQIEQRQKAQKAQEIARQNQQNQELAKKPEAVMQLIGFDVIELEVGVGLVPLVGGQAGQDLRDRIMALRRQITAELGLVVPPVRVRDSLELTLNQYRIRIRGASVATSEVRPDRFLAMGGQELGIDGAILTKDPVFGLPAYWIREDARDRAELAGATVIDAGSILVTHLAEVIRHHAHEILDREEVKKLVDYVKLTHPVVVSELIPDLLTLGEVERVLANLLREKVSIRDMPTILEALADGARTTRDIDLLTEQVRQQLSRHITEPLIKQGFLHAVVLSPAIEQEMKDALEQTDRGTYLNLDPTIAQKVVNALNTQLLKLPQGVPKVVISSPYVRLYFKRLTERLFKDLTVLSYAEIQSDIGIKTMGVVEI
ncbi:flagellar biosynthesis protein FlhA [Sulfobacillus thermosulfidooxidans]|uniref:flagellar biosynthesis protein FlhA n=1 Tax=Sulfobacillus thermosulfidooxidans TaxID=28034 RepID=UPI00096B7835|nr:flagellar biosynthesis protein FlhA [Sulfobacillus thermosulfidooxidans]OLZ10253.1 flagellar biosynthesis protein FlhA [Sulfobacillus thermosulfidooxidans]OLZ17045.1 flagellar biosynthesis protein FlhA [Sulfobacillus thermosulfidooxidans]OLZ20141.1 flagellar biosynthesis protein FlhA [Sulfobacillus thermosulfidooxidans]